MNSRSKTSERTGILTKVRGMIYHEIKAMLPAMHDEELVELRGDVEQAMDDGYKIQAERDLYRAIEAELEARNG